jgi:hypothetical protein
MSSWKRIAAVAIVGVSSCALGVVLLSGSLVRGDDDSDNTAGQRTAAGQQNKTIKLQGKGRQASEKFVLEPGLSIFEVTNNGTANFIVRLLDENGKDVDMLINQIGPFAGDVGYGYEQGGRRLLDVAADGEWTVSIRQPRPTQGESLPATLQGTGSHATPFIQLEKGLVIFKMQHNGEGRFSVKLRDKDGKPIEQLVNTLGAFDGSKPISIEEPGIYFLNVSADGDW